MNVVMKVLTTPEDLGLCEDIERIVWGLPDRDIVPASQLIAAVHAGGMVAGAFVDETMVGFVYGFIAHHPDWQSPTGLHSHMLAVLPQYRNLRIGQQLKWFQRCWCLERGLKWITWTFDPMQAKNARLNFSYLGVTARHYYINTYGAMQGILNEGLPSDRLLAEWHLDAPQVVARAAGDKSTEGCPEAALDVLQQTDCGIAVMLDADATHLRVTVPADIRALYKHSRDQALEHLLAVREVMQTYLSAGYTITGFLQNAYILTRETKRI
jgi:predicted GNAT superfamily acetyltransferase